MNNNDDVLVRIQIAAALRYINRTTNDYAIDMKSCRFWQKLPVLLKPWPLVRSI